MKIVFVNYSYGKTNRGAEIFVNELSKQLEKLGHKVDVVSAKREPLSRWPVLWRFYLDPQGIRIFLFSLGNLITIWKEKYEIVIPIDGGWESYLMRVITWLYGGKLIISGQSGKGWDDRINLWSFPDTFVALNERLFLWAKKWQPFINIKKIYNGVDLNEFSIKGDGLKTGMKRPLVLCVSALTENKRIDLAIKSVSRINGSLLVVGDGNLKSKLEIIGKKLLNENFKVMKFDHKDMPRVYRDADIFTFPTVWWESFGIAMVEAMASGLAVIATDDPIRREIVGEGGLFVDPTDINQYARALKKGLTMKWGIKPRQQAEKFSWEKIAKEYEKLFLEIIN